MASDAAVKRAKRLVCSADDGDTTVTIGDYTLAQTFRDDASPGDACAHIRNAVAEALDAHAAAVTAERDEARATLLPRTKLFLDEERRVTVKALAERDEARAEVDRHKAMSGVDAEQITELALMASTVLATIAEARAAWAAYDMGRTENRLAEGGVRDVTEALATLRRVLG